ncbi:sugar phosphate isomerase/epimerase family protein [Psychromicrobium xiongbiense]|uniref:sugar phosphate isomerase/epimerase family protein n=1 Tax=Psychromicrobium xiongbiense TaxID=3051184 RepID=UPI0025530DC4|nr:sugar phosphate isomerase/epimerase family protein [Psychromicrobium sp. YIM S02556]
MPLAYSTLGAPGYSLDQVIAAAENVPQHRVSGVELRVGEGQLAHPGLSRAERVELRSRLAEAGVQVLTLSSYIRVNELQETDQPQDRQISELLGLAVDLGATGIRVFSGGSFTDLTDEQTDAELVAGLAGLDAAVAGSGVRILLETHDRYRTGADVARALELLEAVRPGHGVRAIWDAKHPWNAGEPVERTAEALLPWLAYVQLKDARVGGELTLPGRGDIPLQTLVELAGPDGWYSLEWERAWHPELPPVEEALSALVGLGLPIS